MKEYKIIKAKDDKDAEDKMNCYATDGWSVIAVTSWQTATAFHLLITFERIKEIL